MTKKPLVLAKPYFDGLNWHQGVGEAFDTSALDEGVRAKLEAKGFLMTASAFKARTNPEAAQAQEAADATAGELSRVLALFPDARTADDVITGVDGLRAQVPSAEQLEEHSSNATVIAALQGLYPDVAQGGLLDAVKASRDGAARAATLQTVHSTEGGTKLPTNFKKVGALTKIGLDTWEGLQGKTWQQLTAIEGVTDEDAKDIAQKVEAHFAPPE